MMELPRPISPASSSASSLDSNGLPIGRIKCSKDKIFIGERHYPSATDALLAYLRQFETLSSSVGDKNSVAPSLMSSKGSSRGTPTNGVNGVNGASDGETTPRSSLSSDPNGVCVNNKKDEVEQLLTSKTNLKQVGEFSTTYNITEVCSELKEEVTDTLREIKLKNLLKKAVSKSQKPGKTGLQQEVEAALARSAQLLEKVTMEDIQSTAKEAAAAATASASDNNFSDISLPTQLLLAEAGALASLGSNGNTSSDSILSQDSHEGRTKHTNGHVYSYHTKDFYLNRSLNSSLSPTADLLLDDSHNLRHSRQRQRRHNLSHDDLSLSSNHLTSPTHSHLRHHRHRITSSSSSNSSKFSDNLSDNLRRIRSKSVPPNAFQNETARLLGELNLKPAGSNRVSVPSWVDKEAGLDTSSVGLSNPASKPTIPQWVEDVAKSDISIDNMIAEHNRNLMLRQSKHTNGQLLSNSMSFSKSEGDLLNLKDELSKMNSSLDLSNTTSNQLHVQPPSLEKHVTFTDSPLSLSKATRQPPSHSTPLRGHSRLKTTAGYCEATVNGHAVCSAKQFGEKAVSVDGESDIKSSSLDTLALLTGKPHTRHRGPDLPKGNTLASKMFPESPILSSIEQDRTLLNPSSPANSVNGVVSSSDGLDGDRSWEKHTTSFKPPVPVGSSDQTHGKGGDPSKKNSSSSLSGGNQPGSMETLKNMLFKLQKEETSVNASNSSADGTEQTTHNPSGLPALEDYDFQTEPGGHSLEKALHHLDRLKTLVKNTSSNGQPDIVNGMGGKETTSTIS